MWRWSQLDMLLSRLDQWLQQCDGARGGAAMLLRERLRPHAHRVAFAISLHQMPRTFDHRRRVSHSQRGAGRNRVLADLTEIEGMRSDQRWFTDRARLDQVLSAQRQQA